jgi:cholesterol transport system auxiliary component
MRLMRAIAVLATAGTAALALGGCISVFPKSKPAVLYRFDVPASESAPAQRPMALIKGPVDFTRAAASDRILTSDGSTVAYIAGARWVSTAPALFDEALERAFNAPNAPMLVGRVRAGPETPVLALDVQTFETRYQGGASPTVVVEVRADLIRPADRATLAEKTFHVETPAGDNRVGPIVQAYDTSVSKVLGDLTAWSAGYAARAPGG